MFCIGNKIKYCSHYPKKKKKKKKKKQKQKKKQR